MHAAGVADFSMADIYHPTFKRTKVHLSALINLCKFWAEQHGIYEVSRTAKDLSSYSCHAAPSAPRQLTTFFCL